MFKKTTWMCLVLAVVAGMAQNSAANAQTVQLSWSNSMSKGSYYTINDRVKPSRVCPEIVPSPEQIKQHIADLSQKYGLDYNQLYSVVDCESSFVAKKYGDGGKAFGIAQFHKPTFDQYCQGDYYDTYNQLDCMAEMFTLGQAKQWSCFKKLFAEVIFHDNRETNQLSIAEN